MVRCDELRQLWFLGGRRSHGSAPTHSNTFIQDQCKDREEEGEEGLTDSDWTSRQHHGGTRGFTLSPCKGTSSLSGGHGSASPPVETST